jgi:thiamine pyrophosphate-dependent acetolactate synthase large subunit-like protein
VTGLRLAGTECGGGPYNLPITWIVFNNGGIGGHRAELFERDHKPVGGMSLGARYDIMMQGLGGAAFNATNSDELDAAIEAALKIDGPSLINVPLDPDAKRKPQKFGWLTRTND